MHICMQLHTHVQYTFALAKCIIIITFPFTCLIFSSSQPIHVTPSSHLCSHNTPLSTLISHLPLHCPPSSPTCHSTVHPHLPLATTLSSPRSTSHLIPSHTTTLFIAPTPASCTLMVLYHPTTDTSPSLYPLYPFLINFIFTCTFPLLPSPRDPQNQKRQSASTSQGLEVSPRLSPRLQLSTLLGLRKDTPTPVVERDTQKYLKKISLPNTLPLPHPNPYGLQTHSSYGPDSPYATPTQSIYVVPASLSPSQPYRARSHYGSQFLSQSSLCMEGPPCPAGSFSSLATPSTVDMIDFPSTEIILVHLPRPPATPPCSPVPQEPVVRPRRSFVLPRSKVGLCLFVQMHVCIILFVLCFFVCLLQCPCRLSMCTYTLTVLYNLCAVGVS